MSRITPIANGTANFEGGRTSARTDSGVREHTPAHVIHHRVAGIAGHRRIFRIRYIIYHYQNYIHICAVLTSRERAVDSRIFTRTAAGMGIAACIFQSTAPCLYEQEGFPARMGWLPLNRKPHFPPHYAMLGCGSRYDICVSAPRDWDATYTRDEGSIFAAGCGP